MPRSSQSFTKTKLSTNFCILRIFFRVIPLLDMFPEPSGILHVEQVEQKPRPMSLSPSRLDVDLDFHKAFTDRIFTAAGFPTGSCAGMGVIGSFFFAIAWRCSFVRFSLKSENTASDRSRYEVRLTLASIFSRNA